MNFKKKIKTRETFSLLYAKKQSSSIFFKNYFLNRFIDLTTKKGLKSKIELTFLKSFLILKKKLFKSSQNYYKIIKNKKYKKTLYFFRLKNFLFIFNNKINKEYINFLKNTYKIPLKKKIKIIKT